MLNQEEREKPAAMKSPFHIDYSNSISGIDLFSFHSKQWQYLNPQAMRILRAETDLIFHFYIR